MSTKTMYAVMANSDTSEGRGPLYVVCLTGDQQLAKDITVSEAFTGEYGVMGVGKGIVEEVSTVSSMDEFSMLAKKHEERRLRR